MQVETTHLDTSEELLERLAEDIDFDGAALADIEHEHALAEWLDATLCSELGLDHVERDEDGDIPIRYGRSTVYVREGKPDSPYLTVIALLLEEFEPSLALYEAVNAINLQVPSAKTVVDLEDGQVITSVALPVIDTLSPRDLMLAIETVADAADYFDTLLQNRFGGATSFDS